MARLIVNSLSELAEAVAVSPNLQFTKIKAAIQRVERTFIKPALDDIYTTLLTQLETPPVPDTYQAQRQQLHEYLKQAVGNLAWWIYTDAHNVNIDSNGIHITVNEHSKQAFQHQTEALKMYFRDAGFEALEYALEYVEKESTAFDYENSNAFKLLNALFIKNATAFNEFIDIKASRFVFLQLLPIIKRIEKDTIKPILGADAYQALKAKLDKTDQTALTDTETAWMELIPTTVSHVAMYHAIDQRMVSLDETGFLIYNGAGSSGFKAKEPADHSRINATRSHFQQLAEQYKEQLNALVNPPQPVNNDAETPTTDGTEPTSIFI